MFPHSTFDEWSVIWLDELGPQTRALIAVLARLAEKNDELNRVMHAGMLISSRDYGRHPARHHLKILC